MSLPVLGIIAILYRDKLFVKVEVIFPRRLSKFVTVFELQHLVDLALIWYCIWMPNVWPQNTKRGFMLSFMCKLRCLCQRQRSQLSTSSLMQRILHRLMVNRNVCFLMYYNCFGSSGTGEMHCCISPVPADMHCWGNDQQRSLRSWWPGLLIHSI